MTGVWTRNRWVKRTIAVAIGELRCSHLRRRLGCPRPEARARLASAHAEGWSRLHRQCGLAADDHAFRVELTHGRSRAPRKPQVPRGATSPRPIALPAWGASRGPRRPRRRASTCSPSRARRTTCLASTRSHARSSCTSRDRGRRRRTTRSRSAVPAASPSGLRLRPVARTRRASIVGANGRPSAGDHAGARAEHIVLVLAGKIDTRGRYWVRVRLPILPNGSPLGSAADALSGLRQVRARLRRWTSIERNSVSARCCNLPHPHRSGEASVADAARRIPHPGKALRVQEDPIYGPLAFGLNARSAVLTDWLNGGFIGIHGTNRPGILPGQVSHGCIRMPNHAILRLARLMPLGTPVTIH